MGAQPLYEYPALTGLRGLAAGWVLIYHAWVLAEPRLMILPLGTFALDLTPFFSGGWFGVDIFFSLSAFLLALPFVRAQVDGKPKPRLRDYFKRRVLRILPAYYAQLALVLIFIGITEQRMGLSASSLAAHAVLWLNLGPAPVAPLINVWWTLPIEFSYYLLLPLLAPLLNRQRVLWLLGGAIVITFLYRYGMYLYAIDRSVAEKVVLLEQLPGRLDQFVIGSAAAVWVAQRPDCGRALSAGFSRLFVLGGALLVGTLILLLHWNSMEYWNGHPLLFCFHMLASFGIAAFIIGACSENNPDLGLLRSRPMVLMGTTSYSLYLWHLPILEWLAKQPNIDLPSPYLLPAFLIVGGSLALLAAWVSWRVVEVPFLRMGRSRYVTAQSANATSLSDAAPTGSSTPSR